MATDSTEHPGFQVVAPGAAVADAVDAGFRPPAQHVRQLAESGARVLVRFGPSSADAALPAEVLAEIAVYAWLGARVFATDYGGEAERVLAMVSVLAGEAPPAAVRRGLA